VSEQLIDDNGEVWDGGSIVLRQNLFASGTGPGFSEYVIKNLGFIGIRFTERAAHIRLRPTVVSPVAMASLLYCLSDRRPQRALLTTYDDSTDNWAYEILGSPMAILKRLSATAAARPGRTNAVRRQSRDAGRLSGRSPLRGALQCWADHRGHFDRAVLEQVIHRVLKERYILLSAAGQSSDLLIRDVGAGLPEFARTWLSRALGQRVEDQPDYDYGRSCAAAYAEAIARQEPILEDVDAVVSWPGYGRLRRRYTRAILPFTGAQGERWLLSTSVENRRIEPRAEV
jgi:hypothetical protein